MSVPGSFGAGCKQEHGRELCPDFVLWIFGLTGLTKFSLVVLPFAVFSSARCCVGDSDHRGFPYLRNPFPRNPTFVIPAFRSPRFGIPTFRLSVRFSQGTPKSDTTYPVLLNLFGGTRCLHPPDSRGSRDFCGIC